MARQDILQSELNQVELLKLRYFKVAKTNHKKYEVKKEFKEKREEKWTYL